MVSSISMEFVSFQGDNDKAQQAMRKAWTQMNKEKRMKYVNIAHERNAKNIAEHQAAKVAAEEKKKVCF